MPELPEVEIMRRYFESAALNKKIQAVEFHDPLNKVFASSHSVIQEALIGQEFQSTKRVGKFLFAAISNGLLLHIHFGMTGDLELYTANNLPRFTRFAIVFTDGSKLAFRDQRKFGSIEVIDSIESFTQERKLGTDLLETSPENFIKAISKRKMAIKTALLDQKNYAGIGNWIADEMLFNCGIHPEHKCLDLTEEQLIALLDDAKKIVREAINQDTHYGEFPEHFFANFRKEGILHPEHPNSPVERMVVGGRGTFIVPEKQKL